MMHTMGWSLLCGCIAACGGAAASDGSDASDVSETSGADADAQVQADAEAQVQDAEAWAEADARAEAADAWFVQDVAWTRSVAGVAPDPRSAAMIGALGDRGGWGNGGRFQIDFSITVLDHDGAAYRAFVPNEDFYEGDCDQVPMPVPAGGALEGEAGYRCTHDGDCHLIVRDGSTLFEMWRADIGDSFSGGCLAVWDLTRTWPATLRGEGCTSADAAGLPIAPLLFTADEVASGHIDHAIRFILPNPRIAHRQYVRPATHATGAASAESNGMPYGVRLRLRADYPLAALSAGARVVAKAMQEYGMILADGGEIALTAASDRDAAHTWEGLLGPRDLAALQVGDFDVVDMGAIIDWTGDCARTP